MEGDRLNPEDEDYVKPQMSYCCGSKGIVLSPKFKDARTRCLFVALVFVIKLVQLTFIAFVLYDLCADDEAVPFNIIFVTAAELKPYNWAMLLTGGVVLLIYSAARCAGAGRRFLVAILLLLIDTFGICVFCSGLITTDLVYPYRYIIFLIVASVGLICLGICVMTTLFEMDVVGRGMFSSLFIYFLAVFLVAHFAFVSTLREKYGMVYFTFLQHVGIGGGVGLFIGMVMMWYVQELILGKVISLHESDYVYVNLMI